MYIDIFTDLQIGAKWVVKQGLKWGDTFLVCKAYTFFFTQTYTTCHKNKNLQFEASLAKTVFRNKICDKFYTQVYIMKF